MSAPHSFTEPKNVFLPIQGLERERHITFTYYEHHKNSPIRTLEDETFQRASFHENEDGRPASSSVMAANRVISSQESFSKDRRSSSARSLSQDVATLKVSPVTRLEDASPEHVVRPLTRHSQQERLQGVFLEDMESAKTSEDADRPQTTDSGVVPGTVDDRTTGTPDSSVRQQSVTVPEETPDEAAVVTLTDHAQKSIAVLPMRTPTDEEKDVATAEEVTTEDGKPQDTAKDKHHTDRQLYLSVIRLKRRLLRDRQNLARTQSVTNRNFCILLMILALLVAAVIIYLIVDVATEPVVMTTPRPAACLSSPCRNDGVCVESSDGETFTCICAEGWSGLNCRRDVNECAAASVRACDVRAVCTNSLGSFECTCEQGFTGDGFSCQDVDECTDDVAACSDVTNADCVNTEGSFRCVCRDGYEDLGGQCTDINECAVQSGGCDVERGQCVNTDGGRTCQCQDGYQGDGTANNCFDVDECAENTNACPDPNSSCANTAGSFQCDCKDGYVDGPAGFCTEIDECTSSPCANGGTCVNLLSRYLCLCDVGWTGDTCELPTFDNPIFG